MKRFIFTATLIVSALFGFGQNDIGQLIQSNADLSGFPKQQDTLFLNQISVIKITETSTTNVSNVLYEDASGSVKSANVFALVGDSAVNKASIVLTLNDTNRVDSIKVNGVALLSLVTAASANVGDYAQLLASYISDTTNTNPNYTATADSALGTVTITPTSTRGDSAGIYNTFAVRVVGGSVSQPTQNLTGGYWAKDLISDTWTSDLKLFQATEPSRAAGTQLFNALRVMNIASGGSLNTVLYYKGAVNYTVPVTENRTTIQTRINAL